MVHRNGAEVILLNITRWPSIGVFALAGFAGTFLALVTVNLVNQAYASLEFIKEHGWTAIKFGALWQVGELLIWGGFVLLSWLVFKCCEKVLEDRYLVWARRERGRKSGKKEQKADDAPLSQPSNDAPKAGSS